MPVALSAVAATVLSTGAAAAAGPSTAYRRTTTPTGRPCRSCGFGTAITSRECAGGPATCAGSIDAALTATYDALVQANGSSDVAPWTASTASKAAGQTMPVFDAIQFRALGIVGQPAIDWQNRPTFQQVVQFSRHRPG